MWFKTFCILIRGPIYKISYDFSYDYLKFIVRSTYDHDSSYSINLRRYMSWALSSVGVLYVVLYRFLSGIS